MVLVDAGGRGSGPLIEAGLEAIGSSIESVALVVLTHHHPDHTGGLAGVVERSSASVAAHTLEAPIIDGSVRMPNPYRNKLFGAVAVPVVASINGPPVGVDHHLEDGDRLPVGDEIRVVHTPGHTQGSTCLLLEPRGVLIVGDALQYKSGRLGLPAALVTQDVEEATASIGKMAEFEFDTIAFSHFPPLRVNAGEAIKRLTGEASA